MKALCIHAGPRARVWLRERGLEPRDVRVVPGAAGGPKALVLTALDRLLLSQWLPRGGHTVHLIGASVGAWRMALACLSNSEVAFDRWAHDYVTQDYPHAPGRTPTPSVVSGIFADRLRDHFAGREGEVLEHPHYRVHVITSRGRHILQRDGARGSRLTTPLGYLGAAVTNAANRRAMGAWLERVVFSDARDALPFPLDDFRTVHARLSEDNLRASILASCTVPFWLESVRDIPGGPRGAYWDGGITDYHLHLRYAAMPDVERMGCILGNVRARQRDRGQWVVSQSAATRGPRRNKHRRDSAHERLADPGAPKPIDDGVDPRLHSSLGRSWRRGSDDVACGARGSAHLLAVHHPLMPVRSRVSPGCVVNGACASHASATRWRSSLLAGRATSPL